jgi:Helix-turn-helix domain
VEIPLEAYTSDLTDFQFRLLAILCLKSGSEGGFKTSVADLCALTGKSSDKTVRAALKALEEKNFLTRTSTRRANGYKGKDIYEIVVKNYQVTKITVVKNYRTSLDYRSRSRIVDKPLVPNRLTSYKLKDMETASGSTKEVKIFMRKYEDDGEDLAGFGLVENRDAPQPKIKRSDPKTRGRRPEHEWSPMDVAAEFSFRVGRKYPLLPGTVNVKNLSGALAKFRKQYDTNALIELELLRLFMADERNFKDIGDEAPHLYRIYLASFGKKMNQARENLGLNKVTAPSETVVKMATLTASDGRVFQNSMSGRAQLERHENRLKG